MIILFILFVVLVIWALGIEEDVETHDELERKIRNKRWEKNEKD